MHVSPFYDTAVTASTTVSAGQVLPRVGINASQSTGYVSSDGEVETLHVSAPDRTVPTGEPTGAVYAEPGVAINDAGTLATSLLNVIDGVNYYKVKEYPARTPR